MKKLCRIREIRPAERRNNGGFSLIELSMVLIIMGLIMVPLIKTYDRYQTQQRINDTKLTLSLINSALSDYYTNNQRYPCPADAAIGFNELNHGNEECTTLTAMSNGTCVGGLCRAASVVGSQPIYIGAVPYVTLGIPSENVMDGWKKKITYVVTGSQTVASTFDVEGGVVQLVDEFANVIASDMHGVLISAGVNGGGAYNLNGAATPCPTGVAESENCDNDGTFMSSLIYEGDGPEYYDDYVTYNKWFESNIWNYVSNEHIANTNTGNIGIGTSSPGERLDVVGNIRAQEMHGTQFCDNATTPNCMLPEVVGGIGRDCASSNEAVTAIRNNNVECQPMTFDVNDITCPPGEFITSIIGGVPDCSPVVTPG